MGKASRKKRNREEKAAVEASNAEAQTKATNTKHIYMYVIPAIGLALGAYAYYGLDEPTFAGISVFIAVGIWLTATLGSLGASIPANDRASAASIDFGRK